jgi:hypothetical protein
LKGLESTVFSRSRLKDAAVPFRTVQIKEQGAFEEFEANQRPFAFRSDSLYDWSGHLPAFPVDEAKAPRFLLSSVRWASDVNRPVYGFAPPPSVPRVNWTAILHLANGKSLPSAAHELPALSSQPRSRPTGTLDILRTLLHLHGTSPNAPASAAPDSLFAETSLGPCVPCERFGCRRIVWITGVSPAAFASWADLSVGLGASVQVLPGPDSDAIPESFAHRVARIDKGSNHLVILCDTHRVDAYVVSLHKFLNSIGRGSVLTCSFVLMVVPSELQLPDLTVERASEFCNRFYELVSALNKSFGLGNDYKAPKPRMPLVPVYTIRLLDYP